MSHTEDPFNLLDESHTLQSVIQRYFTSPKGTPGRFEHGLELRRRLEKHIATERDHAFLRLAVGLDCDLLEACPPESPDRLRRVKDLLISIRRWAEHSQSDLPALEDALALTRTLNSNPKNERVHRATREALADLLWLHHQRAGHGPLDEVVSLLRENLAIMSATDAGRALLCIKLAHALVAQENQRNSADEGRTIRIIIVVQKADEDTPLPGSEAERETKPAPGALLHEALGLHPPGHPEHAGTCAAVARVIDDFERQHAVLKKSEISALGRTLLAAPCADVARRARSLFNMAEASAAVAAADERRLALEPAWVDESVALYLAALRLGYEDRDQLCSNASDLLWTLSCNAPEGRLLPAIAARVIEVRRELVAALTQENQELPYSKGFLALALVQHPDHTEADRAEARRLLREATQGVRKHHPNYDMFLDMRARLLAAHYEETKDAADLAKLREVEREIAFSKSLIGRAITKFRRFRSIVKFVSRIRFF
jgi:hypothetical protein